MWREWRRFSALGNLVRKCLSSSEIEPLKKRSMLASLTNRSRAVVLNGSFERRILDFQFEPREFTLKSHFRFNNSAQLVKAKRKKHSKILFTGQQSELFALRPQTCCFSFSRLSNTRKAAHFNHLSRSVAERASEIGRAAVLKHYLSFACNLSRKRSLLSRARLISR
jgi:hypothetical protein